MPLLCYSFPEKEWQLIEKNEYIQLGIQLYLAAQSCGLWVLLQAYEICIVFVCVSAVLYSSAFKYFRGKSFRSFILCLGLIADEAAFTLAFFRMFR